MRKYFAFSLIISLMLLSACTKTPTTIESTYPSNYTNVNAYLKALSFTIAKELPEDKFAMPTPGPRLALLELFSNDINSDIRPYIGKEITQKNYLLKDYSLQKTVGNNVDLIASIWLIDNKIIGGTIQAKQKNSAIFVSEGYSLRGRSLKDMTGMDFNDWFMNWKDTNYKK